jgi:hypothetical protein
MIFPQFTAPQTIGIPPWTQCPNCSAHLPVSASNIIEYLKKVPQRCTACAEHLDWWKITWSGIAENFMGNQALSFIGAQTAVFTLTLRPGQRTSYRFSEHGVPEGSKVLYVNYTPNGTVGSTLFPLEWHGNVPTVRFRSDEVILFPMPVTDGGVPVETIVSVMATWIPHSGGDESWQNLFDAFEAFIATQYASVIVPANVAVESSLFRLLTKFLDNFVGKKKIEDFLTNAATYSYQLNVLVPILAELKGLPRLPDHVVGDLNRLRSRRNKLAHEGITETPISRTEASELLCAALFGFHYTRYLYNELCGNPAEGDLQESNRGGSYRAQ